MARYNRLEFLLSWRVFVVLIFIGFIPVVGTVFAYCPWFR